MDECRAEYFCLYRQEMEPDVAEVAPYVVQLKSGAAFTRWILEDGWDGHWGIFAVSIAGLRVVRDHLRKIVTVRNEDGKEMYFRYYDPRVLRVYLPTCQDLELKTMFGPVSQYLAENDEPGTLVRFSLEEMGLRREVVKVGGGESS